MLKKLSIVALLLGTLSACEDANSQVRRDTPEMDRAGNLRIQGVLLGITYHSGMAGGSELYTDENGEVSEITWSGWSQTTTVTGRFPFILEDSDEDLATKAAVQFCDDIGLLWRPEFGTAYFSDGAWNFEGACQ